MRSVADDLKTEDQAALQALSPDDRVALALALGARDLDAFCLAQNPPLDPKRGVAVLERQRQAGRRRSRSIEETIG